MSDGNFNLLAQVLVPVGSALVGALVGGWIAVFATKRLMIDKLFIEAWGQEITLLKDLGTGTPGIESIKRQNFKTAMENYNKQRLAFVTAVADFQILSNVYNSGFLEPTIRMQDALIAYNDYLIEKVDPLLERLRKVSPLIIVEDGRSTPFHEEIASNQGLLDEAEEKREAMMHHCISFADLITSHIKNKFSLNPMKRWFTKPPRLIGLSTNKETQKDEST